MFTLSASQVTMFCRCPQQYFRRYVRGEIIPPGVAMLQGTAVHTAAKENFGQKIKSGRDLPASQIIEIAVEDFAKQAAEHDVKYTGDDKDAVALFADGHARMQAPDYMPTVVEHKVTVPVMDGCSVVSVFDLIADGQVVDLKTTSRRYSEDAAAKSIQLATYSYAYEVTYAKKPDALVLDVLVSGRSGVSRQKLSSPPTTEMVVRLFLRRAEALVKALETGAFPPCDPTSWVCDPKWCGYYSTCPYVH